MLHTDFYPFYIYFILSITVVFYNRPGWLWLLVTVCSSAFLYGAYLFFGDMATFAMLIHVCICGYLVFVGKKWLLAPFTIMNLFNCNVIIPHAAGGKGVLSVGMLFEPELTYSLVNVLWELSSMSKLFLMFFIPVFLIVEGLKWRKRRQRPQG